MPRTSAHAHERERGERGGEGTRAKSSTGLIDSVIGEGLRSTGSTPGGEGTLVLSSLAAPPLRAAAAALQMPTTTFLREMSDLRGRTQPGLDGPDGTRMNPLDRAPLRQRIASLDLSMSSQESSCFAKARSPAALARRGS